MCAISLTLILKGDSLWATSLITYIYNLIIRDDRYKIIKQGD